MAISIRQPETEAELHSVWQLRYAVYVEELNWRESHADHSRRVVVDPLDETAYLLGAWDGNQCVGTIRCNFIRDGNVDAYLEYYRLTHIPSDDLAETSVTTRLMVLPALRSSNLPARLGFATYRAALDQGISTDFCDCIPDSFAYFRRLGYRHHLTNFDHPDYGPGIVLRLDLRDDDHLASIRSPLRKHLASWRAQTAMGRGGSSEAPYSNRAATQAESLTICRRCLS
jgi:hypothetical protein